MSPLATRSTSLVSGGVSRIGDRGSWGFGRWVGYINHLAEPVTVGIGVLSVAMTERVGEYTVIVLGVAIAM